jgi:hypothetical protein
MPDAGCQLQIKRQSILIQHPASDIRHLILTAAA